MCSVWSASSSSLESPAIRLPVYVFICCLFTSFSIYTVPVVALIARAEPRPIVWCGKTGRRFAGQLFFDQEQGFEPGQRQPEQSDILFALFVVVRRDRIGFSGVWVPQFEPFFAAQGDLFVEGFVREVGEMKIDLLLRSLWI